MYEEQLVKEKRTWARRRPRYGNPRIMGLLRRDGWWVNHKRVERLWRAEGLQVRGRARKRRRLGSSEQGFPRHRAQYPNHVWSYDFIFDRTEDGRRVKVLSIVDEYTRECLALIAARRIDSEAVIAALARLVAKRGAPVYIRSDNGPELTAHAVRDWLEKAGCATLFIEPGSPWENPYVESFHGKLRDELLDCELFATLLEAQVLLEQYRIEYNEFRPHRSLDGLTPAEFAAQWTPDASTSSARRGQARFARRCATLDRPTSSMQEAMMPGRKFLPGNFRNGLS
jgi:transposase InsO family protein